MNVFALDNDPVVAAKYHCDKHCVKMIVEAAQMLSTAHRILDGEQKTIVKNNRRCKVWVHPTSDSILYAASHYNHPSSVWTRETAENYKWHYRLFSALCDEYTYRYGKTHATQMRLGDCLKEIPKNIPSVCLTPFALAMKSFPECIDPSNPVESYRKFYMTKQKRFKMTWSKRDVPAWFTVSST